MRIQIQKILPSAFIAFSLLAGSAHAAMVDSIIDSSKFKFDTDVLAEKLETSIGAVGLKISKLNYGWQMHSPRRGSSTATRSKRRGQEAGSVASSAVYSQDKSRIDISFSFLKDGERYQADCTLDVQNSGLHLAIQGSKNDLSACAFQKRVETEWQTVAASDVVQVSGIQFAFENLQAEPSPKKVTTRTDSLNRERNKL